MGEVETSLENLIQHLVVLWRFLSFSNVDVITSLEALKIETINRCIFMNFVRPLRNQVL